MMSRIFSTIFLIFKFVFNLLVIMGFVFLILRLTGITL